MFDKLRRHSTLKGEKKKRADKSKWGAHRHAVGMSPSKLDIGALYKIRVSIDREEQARTNAIEKLTKAAANFGGKDGQLEGFKGSDMSKAVFAAELKRVRGGEKEKGKESLGNDNSHGTSLVHHIVTI